MADLEAMLDLGPGSAVPLLKCVVCGEPVLARRLDARTCSSRCRQGAYRERLRNSPEVN
jgi:predicted nucleic acid-binding Zn ribbon protein